jgi:retinol dehydrogenase 12
VSSSAYAKGKFDPGNLQSNKHFSVLATYAATKLFVVMFTEELASRLKATSVTVNAVHPGIVRTRMMLRAPGALRLVAYLSLPFRFRRWEAHERRCIWLPLRRSKASPGSTL